MGIAIFNFSTVKYTSRMTMIDLVYQYYIDKGINHGYVCVVDINSRVCCLAPRRDNTWLIPIITSCWQFPSISTPILLIKSILKLESRAIAARVPMSPRNLGGKYRCRPHPRSRKCTRQFFFAGSRTCRSCGVFKNWISVAHWPFHRKWRVLHNYDISVLEQVGMSFNGIAYLMKVKLLFKREFHRPLVLEFQMWDNRCKEIQWNLSITTT